MEDCLFCRIVAGEIPAEKIYENGDVLAFLDIKPANRGHVLVIPKAHHRNLLTLPEPAWLAMMKAVHLLAPVIKAAVQADGVNIAMNNEPAAHQVVFHAHVHIIPRFHGDPHQPWRGAPYLDGEAKEVAKKIKAAL